MNDEIVNVSYTNWRGETKVRRVILGQIRFGTTDWHEEPTWLISAFDLDHPAQIWKEFDLAKCDFNREYVGAFRQERSDLLVALSDAIMSPMGVVPKSADDFYDAQTGMTKPRTPKDNQNDKP